MHNGSCAKWSENVTVKFKVKNNLWEGIYLKDIEYYTELEIYDSLCVYTYGWPFVDSFVWSRGESETYPCDYNFEVWKTYTAKLRYWKGDSPGNSNAIFDSQDFEFTTKAGENIVTINVGERPESGICGSANWATYSSTPPSSELCLAWTPTSVTLNPNGTQYQWRCEWRMGRASCSATKQTIYKLEYWLLGWQRLKYKIIPYKNGIKDTSISLPGDFGDFTLMLNPVCTNWRNHPKIEMINLTWDATEEIHQTISMSTNCTYTPYKYNNLNWSYIEFTGPARYIKEWRIEYAGEIYELIDCKVDGWCNSYNPF